MQLRLSPPMHVQDNSRRVEHIRKLWVIEAKDLPAKKKYLCELNGRRAVRCAPRASSRPTTSSGRALKVPQPAALRTVTVHLYRETDKKKKKERSSYLGW